MDAAPPPPASRSCGPCTLCCTVLRVDPLRKLGGVPCAQLRGPTGGCGIYATRPAVCRAYRCLWLQGSLEEQDRPDRLGAVLDLVTEAGQPRLAVREAEPGALERSERLRAIVARYRRALPVRVSDVRRPMDPDAPFRLLMPDGEERRFAGDVVEVLRPGRVPETRRLPWLDRAIRRTVQRWQAVRLRGYGDGARATGAAPRPPA